MKRLVLKWEISEHICLLLRTTENEKLMMQERGAVWGSKLFLNMQEGMGYRVSETEGL